VPQFYTSETVVFRSPAFGALHATVADHVIGGQVIFPGAGYLEMARAAYCAQPGAAPSGAALQGVFFLQPMLLEAAEMHVYCSGADGRFDVCSGELGAYTASMVDVTIHCSGSVAQQESVSWQRTDHPLVRSRLSAHCVDAGALYAMMSAGGATFGPSFRRLGPAWRTSAVCLGQLRAARQHGTGVHPADLDAGMSMKPVLADGPVGLPFVVEEALLYGRAGQRLWAVRNGST